MIGKLVQYVVNGVVGFGGVAEYETADGWVGIRAGMTGDSTKSRRSMYAVSGR